MKHLLKPTGKLLFQIINYDRIINQNIPGLPTIENAYVRFERNYKHDYKRNKIQFTTHLKVKESNQEVENMIELHPMKKSEIEGLLETAGFREWVFYGSFRRDDFTSGSQPLVAEVRS